MWTLSIIRELIAFGVKLSEVSVGRVMKQLGFSAQRPLYRPWQDPCAGAKAGKSRTAKNPWNHWWADVFGCLKPT